MKMNKKPGNAILLFVFAYSEIYDKYFFYVTVLNLGE